MSTQFRSANVRLRRGLSLLEMLASITIIGVLSVVVVPRLGSGGSVAKAEACRVNREIIQIQAALWKRAQGSWPSSTMTSMGSDQSYFPDGMPVCPVDGSSYTLDTTTGMVNGHNH